MTDNGGASRPPRTHGYVMSNRFSLLEGVSVSDSFWNGKTNIFISDTHPSFGSGNPGLSPLCVFGKGDGLVTGEIERQRHKHKNTNVWRFFLQSSNEAPSPKRAGSESD